MFAQLRLRSPSWSKFNHRNHSIHKYKCLCFVALPFSYSVCSFSHNMKFTNLPGRRFACRVPGTYLNEALSLVTPEISHSLRQCAKPWARPTELCIRILDRAETQEDKHSKAVFADSSHFSLYQDWFFLHIYSTCTPPPSLYLTTRLKNPLLWIIDQAPISKRSIYCETRVSINNTKSKISLNTNIQSFHCIKKQV